jgi:hypothetical protein
MSPVHKASSRTWAEPHGIEKEEPGAPEGGHDWPDSQTPDARCQPYDEEHEDAYAG